MPGTRVFERLLTEDLNVGVGATTKTNPGGGLLTGTQVGIHSLAVGGQKVEQTWDPGLVAAGGRVSTTVTVPGAALRDFVLRSFSLDVQGLTFTADVTSANTVTVTLANLTGSAVDLASGTLSVLVLKSK